MIDDVARNQIAELRGQVTTIYELLEPVMRKKIILDTTEYNMIKEAFNLLENEDGDDFKISTAVHLLKMLITAVDSRDKITDISPMGKRMEI